jgi:hypothetical protein
MANFNNFENANKSDMQQLISEVRSASNSSSNESVRASPRTSQ